MSAGRPALAVSLLGACAALGAMITTSSERPPLPLGVKSHDELERYRKAATKQHVPPPSAAAGRPLALVEQPTHDFGNMPPHRKRRHTFVVHNAGDAVLRLKKGATTCRCTELQVLNPAVPPGGKGRVIVAWETDGPLDVYRHSGTVLTNDPERERLELTVKGVVVSEILAHPSPMTLPQLRQDRATVAHTVVGSQVWDAIRVASISCDLPGVNHTIQRPSDSDLKELYARSGVRIELEFPAGMPAGPFEGALKLELAPAEGCQAVSPAPCVVPVEGYVRRSLSVQGQGIDEEGVLRLGKIAVGEGRRRTLLCKVRDDEPDLRVISAASRPAYVEARLAPFPGNGALRGLYKLHVTVPADAPDGVYLANQQGELRLSFDHPRISELKLKLEFAVVQEDEFGVD